MAKRATVGDVLEITTPDGLIYAHYLGKHPEYGDAIVVCPTKHAQRVPVGRELFHGGYVTFYPAVASVNRGLASVVGHVRSSGLPKRVRRPGARVGRKVETWIIEDDSRETVKERLSDEDRELPIAVIWNHELLVQRVSEGWRPEMEGRHE
jgi:hypothetical protein